MLQWRVPNEAPSSLGHYTLLRELGSGGMATVWLGRARASGRIVAIKRLHAHLAKDAVVRTAIADEARLVASVVHPNVVGLLEVLGGEGEMALVFEHVHGLSLAELTRFARERRTPISPAVAVAIVLELLDALDAVHEARDAAGAPLRIVHRDVSPQNVMIDESGAVRLLDFGVAKAAGRLQTTRDGSLKGKLAYMAPEQARAAPVTPATDVYAASVVLWELLAGRRLFAGENEAAVLEQVLVGHVDPPSRHAPEVPDALDDLVRRGLATEPARRFPTARAMATALREAVTPAPRSAVADLIRELGADVLAARRAATELASVSELPTTLPRPSPPRNLVRRPRVLAATAVAMLAAVGLLVAQRTGGREAPRESAPPPSLATEARGASVLASEVSEPSLVAPPTTVDPGLPPRDEVLELDDDAVPPSGVPRSSGASAPVRRAAKTSPRREDCSIPYTRDAQGRKIYKDACLGR